MNYDSCKCYICKNMLDDNKVSVTYGTHEAMGAYEYTDYYSVNCCSEKCASIKREELRTRYPYVCQIDGVWINK